MDKSKSDRQGGNRDRYNDDKPNKMYAQKSENQRGGKRMDKNDRNDRPQRDFVEITNTVMNDTIRSNYKKFIKINKKEDEDKLKPVDPEEEQEPKEEFDFNVFADLKNKNGKPGALILSTLYEANIDVMEEDALKYLPVLMQHFSKNKMFEAKDFSNGLTKFISMFGELALDLPNIHKVAFEGIILPLMNTGSMNLKFVKWEKAQAPEGEDDDEDFDSSDAQFKLAALILNNEMVNKKLDSITQIKDFMADKQMTDLVKNRKDKIESMDELTSELKEQLGGNAEIILKALSLTN